MIDRLFSTLFAALLALVGNDLPQFAMNSDILSPDAEERLSARVMNIEAMRQLALPQSAQTTGPLPQLLYRLAVDVTDFSFDKTRNRIYVIDAHEKLHVIDARDFTNIDVIEIKGALRLRRLALDAANSRLYVSTDDDLYNDGFDDPENSGDPSIIYVLDTSTFAVVGQLPGENVAIDQGRNRLFVGERWTYELPADAQGVRIYDLQTFELLNEIPQAGIPHYNPQRNEVLIVGCTVYAADPETQQITRNLSYELLSTFYPYVSDSPADDDCWLSKPDHLMTISVYPEFIVGDMDVSPHCIDSVCFDPPPRYLSATTLELADVVNQERWRQPNCDDTQPYLGPIDGRIYSHLMPYRWDADNVVIQDTLGAEIGWRDGLRPSFINPNTRQMFLASGIVLELNSLTPIGRHTLGKVLCFDQTEGLIYSRADGGELQVFAEKGAYHIATSDASIKSWTYDRAVQQLEFSPTFAKDRTAFYVSKEPALYQIIEEEYSPRRVHSVDGLFPPDSFPSLAISPSFASDQTLLISAQGVGIWRSDSGGSTWQPVWDGLNHLRIIKVGFSLYFEADATVYAYAKSLRLPSDFDSRRRTRDQYALYGSTDSGQSWQFMMSAWSYEELPTIEALAARPAPQPLPIRFYSGSEWNAYDLEITEDAGKTWRPLAMDWAERERLVKVANAPDYPNDFTTYVLSSYGLWRTRNGGRSWEVAAAMRIDAEDRAAPQFSDLSVSPTLPDGSYHILLAKQDGQIEQKLVDKFYWDNDLCTLDSGIILETSVFCVSGGNALSTVGESFVTTTTVKFEIAVPLDRSSAQDGPDPFAKVDLESSSVLTFSVGLVAPVAEQTLEDAATEAYEALEFALPKVTPVDTTITGFPALLYESQDDEMIRRDAYVVAYGNLYHIYVTTAIASQEQLIQQYDIITTALAIYELFE